MFPTMKAGDIMHSSPPVPDRNSADTNASESAKAAYRIQPSPLRVWLEGTLKGRKSRTMAVQQA